MADSADRFIDRLMGVRNAARESARLVRRLAAEAPSDKLDDRRGGAARALAASIKAIGQEIVAEAEKLERKL